MDRVGQIETLRRAQLCVRPLASDLERNVAQMQHVVKSTKIVDNAANAEVIAKRAKNVAELKERASEHFKRIRSVSRKNTMKTKIPLKC
jgi:hypothetical protein